MLQIISGHPGLEAKNHTFLLFQESKVLNPLPDMKVTVPGFYIWLLPYESVKSKFYAYLPQSECFICSSLLAISSTLDCKKSALCKLASSLPCLCSCVMFRVYRSHSVFEPATAASSLRRVSIVGRTAFSLRINTLFIGAVNIALKPKKLVIWAYSTN